MDKETKFRRVAGCLWLGCLGLMSYAESDPVATLACSPLVHYMYALHVAKPTRCHTFDFVVMLYPVQLCNEN
jgi:hypothetical protein